MQYLIKTYFLYSNPILDFENFQYIIFFLERQHLEI